MTAFTLEEARDVLATALPGCVRSLGVSVESLVEGKATLRMPAGEQATREGNIFGGQALSVLADSAMCFAIWTDGRGRRPIATVDLHMTFMRAGGGEDVLAHAELVRSGRSLAFARVTMDLASTGQTLATAVATFALPA